MRRFWLAASAAAFAGIYAPIAWACCGTTSINGSTIPSFSSINDSSGNAWTVTSGTCYENGVQAATCTGVTSLLWFNGTIYKNVSSAWSKWTGSAWTSVSADPRVTSTPIATLGTTTPNSSLVDMSGNVWAASNDMFLKCYKNGVQAGVCSNTSLLQWMNGHIFQKNTSGNWYRWNNAADSNPNTFTAIASQDPRYDFYFGLNFSGLECGAAWDNNPDGHNGQMTGTDPYFSYWNGQQVYSIRLPFRWERIQPTLLGALDSTYLGQIETAVNKAAAEQQTVLLDLHNYAAWTPGTQAGGCSLNSTSGDPNTCVADSTCGCYTVGSTSLPNADLSDVWKRIATVFGATSGGVRTYPNILGYDIMNEPSEGGISESQWATAAQAVITAIRTVDTYTPIFVEGVCFSTTNNFATASCNGNSKLSALTDSSNKIVFSGHNYANQGTQSYTTYGGSDTATSMKDNYTGSSNQFANWCKTQVTNGVAVGCHIGEGGVSEGSDSGGTNGQNLLTMMRNAVDTYKSDNFPFHYWSGGPCGQPDGTGSTNLTPTSFGPPVTGTAPQWAGEGTVSGFKTYVPYP